MEQKQLVMLNDVNWKRSIFSACHNAEDDEKCNHWRGKGECEANPDFMADNCARACALCGQGTRALFSDHDNIC